MENRIIIGFGVFGVLVEFAYHLFSLDVAWIFDFVLGQLFWVFVFAAVVVLTFEPKKQFWGFIFFIFFMWALVDVNAYMGWIVGPSFGSLYFVLFSLPAYLFLEKNGVFSRWNVPYAIFGVIILWIFYTLGGAI